MNNTFKSFFLIAACLTLNACAGGARSDLMAVSPPSDFALSKNSKYYNAIALADVTGGKETNPLWMSKVDNAAFQGALAQSLENYGVLDTNSNARYTLETELIALEQPFMGFSFEVVSAVDYKLNQTSNKSVVFDKTVTESGKATMGDSVLGVERLRIANEYSIKNNIQAFVNNILGTQHIATPVKAEVEAKPKTESNS